METNTKALTTCNGKGMSNGVCDTCFQPLQTTSIQCGRLIEVVAPSEEDKQSSDDAYEEMLKYEASEEVKQDIKCPFCSEDGFDKIGLKNHLENYCEEYKITTVLP